MKSYFLPVIILAVGFYITGCKNKNTGFYPKLGVCVSLEDVGIIGNAGFSYAEIGVRELLVPNEPDSVFNNILEFLETKEVKPYACHKFLPGSLKSVGPDAAHDSIIRYAKTAFKRANLLGVKTIVFGSGKSRNYPEGFSKDHAIKQFIKILRDLTPIAANNDLVISVEVLNSNESNIATTIESGLEIVKAVNHPNCKLLVDIYHMTQEGEKPEEIYKAEGYIYHVHIAENENRTAPGVKGDDFRPYLTALKDINYTGNISVECRWGDDFYKELSGCFSELNMQLEAVNQ